MNSFTQNFKSQHRQSFFLENNQQPNLLNSNLGGGLNPFFRSKGVDFSADQKMSINSKRPNLLDSRDNFPSLYPNDLIGNNPQNNLLLYQESFNLNDNLFDDKFQTDKIGSNFMNDTMKQFSNSFVLNTFNNNLKPPLNTNLHFQLAQSKSFSKGIKDGFEERHKPWLLVPTQKKNKDTYKFFNWPVKEPEVNNQIIEQRSKEHLFLGDSLNFRDSFGEQKLKVFGVDSSQTKIDKKVDLSNAQFPINLKLGENLLKNDNLKIPKIKNNEKKKSKRIFKKRNKNNLIKTLSFLVFHFIKQKSLMSGSKEVPTIFDQNIKESDLKVWDLFIIPSII